MKSADPYLQWARILLCLVTHALCVTMTAHACTLPDYLQVSEDDEPWYTRIRHDRVREVGFYVRHNVLEIRHMTSAMPTRRWKCALTFRGKFLLKRTEADTREEYSACVKFIRRSKSIVQMMWSRESDVLDPALCEDRNLDLDDWLLVSYKLLYKDYTPSPFRGGYSMRITDSELGENGCNYMHRPMKFESDCLTGEGVLFDFISETCLPGTAGMFVKQRTLTVASWKHDKTGDHFVVLRRADDEDLYCLRAPDTDESHMNAFLFTDLMCKTDHASSLMRLGSRHGARFLVLHLLRYVYKDLCDDEYPQCSTVTCNSHIRHECHKTCKVCDAENPPATCSYPKRLRGSYYQTDINGYRQVNVTDSEFTVEKLGTFRCVVFPDSPSRRHRIYTTVSTFHNGCRPRYTCLRFKRRGPSVLRYTLSRSYIWPDLEKDFGQSICSDTQFGMDPEPIGDLYRSPEDTGKPIISHDPQPERVPCNLSSTFTITATFPNGSVCYGSLYEHCEDKTRLRIEFHPLCGEIIETGAPITSRVLSESQSIARPVFTDYSCMAHFEGHYWERLLLLQNDHNEKEASCLLFTQLDASESLQMVAGQCDKNSWNYARAGLRVPLLSLRLRPDNFPCKYLPYVPSTTTLSSVTSSHVGGSERLELFTMRTQGQPGHKTLDPVSFTVTLPPPLNGHHPQKGPSASYEEPGEGDTNPIAHRPGLSPAGNEAGSQHSVGGSFVAARITFVSAVRATLTLVAMYWMIR